MSPYCTIANNPVLHTDPDGDILPAIIWGAAIAISAYQGYKIGKAQGATGWGLAGYALVGGAIGAL